VVLHTIYPGGKIKKGLSRGSEEMHAQFSCANPRKMDRFENLSVDEETNLLQPTVCVKHQKH
jgi:hypothetical protein